MGSRPNQDGTRVGRAPRRMLLLAGLITPTLVASCTPEDAGAIAWGRGTITFANDCDAGPTKARFRLPLETPVMRVNLRGRAGTDVVTEFISIKKGGDTVQLLNKYRTDVSPSISSYCKGLPFLELLMRLGLETILSGGSAEGMKKGSLDLLVEACTGSDLRALGTVTVEWEM